MFLRMGSCDERLVAFGVGGIGGRGRDAGRRRDGWEEEGSRARDHDEDDDESEDERSGLVEDPGEEVGLSYEEGREEGSELDATKRRDVRDVKLNSRRRKLRFDVAPRDSRP